VGAGLQNGLEEVRLDPMVRVKSSKMTVCRPAARMLQHTTE
jgi:hypothetical protein